MIPHMGLFLWIIDNKYCKIFLKLQALIDGFNDKKSVDHLYESGGLNDDTDGKPMHGTDEVRKMFLANLMIASYSIWIENNLCNLSTCTRTDWMSLSHSCLLVMTDGNFCIVSPVSLSRA